ncbi:MAG: dCTP deaminase [Thermoleophilia bacterium]
MILSDTDILAALAAGHIALDPFDEALVQPASVDIRVDARFRIFSNHLYTCIDPRERQDDLTTLVQVEEGGVFILHPGEFVLGSTVERVSLGAAYVARLEGKSSLGRLGLLCHATAGWIDPGFSGCITLELSNVANLPIKVYPGMPIGQLSFARLSSPSHRPYGSDATGSKYQDQEGPTQSRMWKNFGPASGTDSG